MEQTLVLIKPDGVSRGLCGEVLRRFERQEMAIVAIKMETLSEKKATEHYAAHKEQDFFGRLLAFVTSGPSMALVLSAPDVVARARRLVGETKEPAAGTIRGDFATDTTYNVVHASDSPASAAREIELFFPELKEIGI